MKSADALKLYAVLPETGDMPKLAAAAIEGGFGPARRGSTWSARRRRGVSRRRAATSRRLCAVISSRMSI